MEWPAHPPLEGGGGVSHIVLKKFLRASVGEKLGFCKNK